MSEAEGPVDPLAEAPRDAHRQTLLYDFAKFLTTLSLLALGGVLSITQAAAAGQFSAVSVGLSLGAIILGGVLALTAVSGLVDAQYRGRPVSPWPARCVKAAMLLLGLGLGVFLRMWWSTL